MSALTEAFSSLAGKGRDLGRRVFARPASYLAAEWERLAPRQRRLLLIFVAATLALVTVFGAWWVFGSISDLEEESGNIRNALSAIAKHRNEYLDAKARSAQVDARIGTEPPQLTGDIEAAAHEEQIEIAESSERPATPAGKRYVEHDVDIKIREVGLQALMKFMRRLETGPRLIFFTHLSIKRRFSDQEKVDVEATATAFERVHEDKTKKKGGAGGEGGKKEAG
jgi:type II secretory pathway component PulM